MKKKELKQLAQKVAKLEMQYQKAEDSKERQACELEIMKLCSQVDSLEEVAVIDELVQDIIEKNF